MVSTDQVTTSYREERWKIRIENASFVHSQVKEQMRLQHGLWPLFISAEPVPEEHFEKDVIHQNFVIPDS